MSYLSWADRSRAFLHDAARCLALVSQGQLELTPQGRLRKASLQTLARQALVWKMRPTDASREAERKLPRNEEQAPGLGFLLGLLQHASLIAPAGERLLLSDKAHAWLDQPAQRQMHSLRRIWFFAPELSWYWVPDDRRSALLERRWRHAVLQAARAVASLSPDAWTPTSEVIGVLEARGVLTWGDVAQNLPRVRRSVRQRTLQLLHFLFQEILPDLSLVELSGAEERQHLRPTPEGAAWLQVAILRSKLFFQPPEGVAVEEDVPLHELRFPAPEEPPIRVAPDLSLSVGLAAPAAHVFDLAHLAELDALGPPARYRVTLPSLQQAVEWGYLVSDAILMLSRFSGLPLPQSIVTQLQDWRQDIVVVPCEPGYRLHFCTPVILETLRRKEPFRRRTLAFASGRHAWVSQAQSRGLWRYLRQQGYAPQVPEAADDDEQVTLDPPLRPPWPLLQWLVLLRTYESLRQRLPSLADLGLQDLQAALETALSPDELAAAERLVASHEALLARSFGSTPPPLDAPDEVPGREEADALVARLEAAIQSDAVLDMTYADTEGKITRRRVRPLELQTRWGQQYLVAYCELRQAERRFRLDRVVQIEEDAG